ncbi:MAG: right-handed parallel beta-helix repeat-containing protein, partial [Bryobacteraceae bacterium]
MSRIRAFLLLCLCGFPAAMGAVRHVGPGQPYATPCQAFAEAQDGDVIEIDASGNYDGDVCPILKNRLTIRGVNGRARIDAAGRYAWGKGIWVVVGDGIVIENIEFSGARVPDRNGAGIRLDSGNLTIRNCVFHHNENGILGGFYGRVVIEHSEFYDNGYGDGYSHNIYLNAIDEFVLQYSASRRSNVGHLVKSRARTNFLLYNRLTQEDGTGSYEIDFPNGGLAYVIGNTVQQGESTQNRGMLSYGFEGLHSSVPSQLYVVNNTFVSTRSAGATFIQIASSVTAPAVIRNNIFSGSGILTTQTGALLSGNVTSGDMGFVNPSAYDYRISNLSAALNAGVAPGEGNGYPLQPVMQYLHPLCAVSRYDVGAIDAGAFEYGVQEVNPVCAAGPTAPPPSLHSLTLSAGSLPSGGSFTATVTLSAAAGAGGVTVALASSAPSVIPVPASITVPQGQTSASVPLTAGQVTSSTTVQITASLNGSSKSASVTVQPPPPPLQVAGLTLSASTVTSGASFTATVTLTAAAGPGGIAVALASSAPSVIPVPASITVPQGQTSATLTLTAGQVTSSTTVQITASLNGSPKSASVTVQPQANGPVKGRLKRISRSPARPLAGSGFRLTVDLESPAQEGGVWVGLASSHSFVRLPESVVVPAGART